MQFPKVIRSADRHALARQNFPAERLHNLSLFAFHSDNVPIQMLKRSLETQQGLLQRNVHIHVQIVAHALEHSVFLLLEGKNYVRLNHVWDLFSLALKLNLVIVGHAAFDVDDKLPAFLDEPLALAVLAVLCVDRAFAFARRADLLSLELHEAHVYHFDCDTLAFALWACLLFAALRSGSLAMATVNITVDCIRRAAA